MTLNERDRPADNGPASRNSTTTTMVAPGTDVGRDVGPLRSRMQDAMREHGLPLKSLTVLASQNDPFRVDTPAGHRDGAWLADQLADLGIGDRTIHLRGLHYAVIGRTRPDGQQYVNSEESWTWLSSTAAKAARWLGYLPWDRIVDQRNAEPLILINEVGDPEPFLSLGGVRVELPDDVDDPIIGLDNIHPQQPFKLVFFGEKSSLQPVLEPLAKRYHADLYLPTGEISDTLMHTMARVGSDDSRPMVVFTFSDCDPAGWQMPISIGRKLQAFQASLFPDLEFQVRRVALLPEHVEAYGLPSTPLKDTEKRADAWTLAKGVMQTEIDALASLQPEALTELAVDALAPFFDHTLARRVAAARYAWNVEAQSQLLDLIGPEELAAFREQAQAKLDALRDEVEAINTALHVDASDLDLPTFDVPLAVVADDPDDPPLIDSRWTFAEQCQRLIASKDYSDGGAR